MIRRPAVCVLMVAGVPLCKQEARALDYVAEHRLTLTSVTGEPRAALALIVAGIIEVVIAVIDRPSVLEIEGQVLAAGGRFDILRRRRPRLAGYRADMVRAAAMRGSTPEVIAMVLGIDLGDVLQALGVEGARHADHAPPPGQRPAPLEDRRPRGRTTTVSR